MLLRALLIATLLLLSGCEIPGLGPDPRIAKREADAKAIGSACRHGLRGIEHRVHATKSNTAMLSTCAVCGNMLTIPAAEQV
jgi:hypothetical protein